VFKEMPVGKVPVVVNCTGWPTGGVPAAEPNVRSGEFAKVTVPIEALMFCPAIKPPSLLLMSIP
jgi:hypothetical protein